jgi:calcineurin-like phosphoesterase family protein
MMILDGFHVGDAKEKDMNIDLDTWIISDTHFGHYNMIKLSGRPLNFNEKIITQWRKHVHKDDVILHLGDLAIFFGPTRDMWASFAATLPGDKYLIKGNHDKEKDSYYKGIGFEVVEAPLIQYFGTIDVEPMVILFSHQPQEPSEAWDLNLHGHMHGNTHHEYPFPLDRHMDVGVDVLGWAPVRLGEILENT